MLVIHPALLLSLLLFSHGVHAYKAGAHGRNQSLTGHWIFVSSGQTGDLGGLAGADSICQTLASSVALNGTWQAVLASDSTSVASRISITGPVYNLAGHIVATSSAQFFGTNWENPVIYDKDARPQYATAVSGANVDGSIRTGANCSNWSSTGGTNPYGCYTYMKSNHFFCGTGYSCNSDSIRFYCVSSNIENKIRTQTDPTLWHYSFVTSASWNGNLGGLAGADDKCQSAAAAAGLPGTYVALLCDSSRSKVSSRIKIITGTKDSLGRILAYDPSKFIYYGFRLEPGLIVDENGALISPTNDAAWAGCDIFGNRHSANPEDICDDWASATGSTPASTLGSGINLLGGTTSVSCATSKRLKCFSTTVHP